MLCLNRARHGLAWSWKLEILALLTMIIKILCAKLIKQVAIILCFIYTLENMARSLNSRCDFKNGFFTCDLPEDAILLVVKVKTKTGNNTLVEDTEKQTEKFRPWKKPTKDRKCSPRKLPGVDTQEE